MGGEDAGLSSRGGEETYRCAGKVFWTGEIRDMVSNSWNTWALSAGGLMGQLVRGFFFVCWS